MFQTPFGNYSRAHPTSNARLQASFGGFKPLSGIILARTFWRGSWYECEEGFKPLSGIILARTLHCVFACRASRRVSNPFRELFSRARRRRRRIRSICRVSNPFRELFSRAHDATGAVGETVSRFQTPFGNYSRAHVTVAVSAQPDACFKPLSGIILARTKMKIIVAEKNSMFQTPFGNYSRAHLPSLPDALPSFLFQTPFGNYSRAHCARGSFRNPPFARFKPLSGIILARTLPASPRTDCHREFQTPFGNYSRAHQKRGGPHEHSRLVSNPFRELFSRAQNRHVFPIQRGIKFQTPFGNYSRAHTAINLLPIAPFPPNIQPIYASFPPQLLAFGHIFTNSAPLCFSPVNLRDIW